MGLRRHETRENAMKILFQTQIQRDDIDEQIARYCEENEIVEGPEHDYFVNVVNGVLGHVQKLDEMIAKHAKGWTISRMPKVDLAIMRICIYEMIYRKDIPATVSMNEAVELTKQYSGDDSKAFVNGVLGKVYEDLNRSSEAHE
jgi:N utilization substance protein B